MTRQAHLPRPRALALASALCCALSAQAIELHSDDPDTRIRLDFTPKYSTAYRLQNPSAVLTSPAARGDGGVQLSVFFVITPVVGIVRFFFVH